MLSMSVGSTAQGMRYNVVWEVGMGWSGRAVSHFPCWFPRHCSFYSCRAGIDFVMNWHHSFSLPCLHSGYLWLSLGAIYKEMRKIGLEHSRKFGLLWFRAGVAFVILILCLVFSGESGSWCTPKHITTSAYHWDKKGDWAQSLSPALLEMLGFGLQRLVQYGTCIWVAGPSIWEPSTRLHVFWVLKLNAEEISEACSGVGIETHRRRIESRIGG